MARTVTKALEQYGPVRIMPPHKGALRVLWTDPYGRQRERSAKTMVVAREIAIEQAKRLTDPAGTVQADALYGALVGQYVDPVARGWERRDYLDKRNIAKNHIIPMLGRKRCDQLTAYDFGALIKQRTADGYSSSTLTKICQLCKAVTRYGKSVGVWASHQDLTADMRVSSAASKEGLHTIKPSELPTTDEVASLVAELTKVDPMYGLMASLASTTGLRWAELIALTASDVDPANRTLTVSRSLAEVEGTFTTKPPKTAAGKRSVIIPAALIGTLSVHMMTVRPGGQLFTTRKPKPGRNLRRSNFNRRVLTPARKASTYPNQLTWHSLRHYAINQWLDAGVKLRNVTRLAGHANSHVTLVRYVGPDSDYLDDAKLVL